MLILNIEQVMADKGISNPAEYLRKAGFTYRCGWRIRTGQRKEVNVKDLEKLCIALQCTPNDILRWIPEEGQSVSDKHPLKQLERTNRASISAELNTMPMEMVNEVRAFITKLKETAK